MSAAEGLSVMTTDGHTHRFTYVSTLVQDGLLIVMDQGWHRQLAVFPLVNVLRWNPS